MKRKPDLFVYATLVEQNVLTVEQAETIIARYKKGNPIPVNLRAAIFLLKLKRRNKRDR